jgi:hypothetical protein
LSVLWVAYATHITGPSVRPSLSLCLFLSVHLYICVCKYVQRNKKYNCGIWQNQALMSQRCHYLSNIRITLLMKDSIKNTSVYGVTCFLSVCTWGNMFSVSLYKILLNLHHSRFRQICCLRGRVVISHPMITVKYYQSISLACERDIVFC